MNAYKSFIVGRLIASAFFAVSFANNVHAETDYSRQFFKNASGTWQGPGEIVAGKYKGTKFNCAFFGHPDDQGKTGIVLEGTCRVGIFRQIMTASIIREGHSYKGRFLDGAQGKGLDIVSGKVSRSSVTVALNRKQLNGAMVARLKDMDNMGITISVKVGGTLVPVIGVELKREPEKTASAN